MDFRRCILNSPALLLLLALLTTGCQSVKPYQRAYLNDHEMQAGQKSIAQPEQNAMSYREGATGGGGGKASGGCGCN
ncbi:MAG: DUF4266 domain-containing protein [Haliscomenobacteraceae bacterium CHB4]|nr:DUF4266 domain-containing protein [Haliscomenobacteraceae bacterium CHB4]